jgi:LAGLIDADG endonuclease
MKSVKNFTANHGDFCDYLAGLFEGDGHISMPDHWAKPANARWHINFNLKDSPLAYHLLKLIQNHTFEVGFVRLKTKNNACVLTISHRHQLIFITHLLHGRLRGPKNAHLNILITWLNQKAGSAFKTSHVKKESLLNDAWLAGFADADLNCYVRQTLKENSQHNKSRVACHLRLEQSMVDKKTGASNKHLISQCAEVFKANLRFKKRQNRAYYIVEASSLNTLGLLRNYFDKYSLQSSKRLDFLDTMQAYDLLKTKQAYSTFGMQAIAKLRQGMNHNRTYFNWTHLKAWPIKTTK